MPSGRQHVLEMTCLFVVLPISPSSCHVAIKNFVLVALHTEPRQAVQEVDRLYDVFEEVVKKWSNMVRFYSNTMNDMTI